MIMTLYRNTSPCHSVYAQPPSAFTNPEGHGHRCKTDRKKSPGTKRRSLVVVESEYKEVKTLREDREKAKADSVKCRDRPTLLARKYNVERTDSLGGILDPVEDCAGFKKTGWCDKHPWDARSFCPVTCETGCNKNPSSLPFSGNVPCHTSRYGITADNVGNACKPYEDMLSATRTPPGSQPPK